MKKIQTGVQWSRYCLRSLFVTFLLMLTFGVTDAWGATSSVNTPALWKSCTYDAGDSVVWSAPHVTFKLHGGGNIELYLNDHILIQKDRTYTLDWRVDDDYDINVTQVSVHARSTLNSSYITVGTYKSDNVGPAVGIGTYSTVNSQSLSLGNNGSVSIRPESDNGDAIFHMDGITITYTIEGEEKTVTFDSWNDYDHTKTATTEGPFVKSPEDGTTFTMGGDFKRYTKKNDESDTHFFLTNTTTGLFGKSYTGTLSWTQPTGYTIAVEGISINTFSKGKLYIWPNDDTSKEIRIIDNYTNTAGQTITYVYNLTYTYSNNSTGYLFPGGNKMGVSDQFKFKATSNEVKINTLTVKYTLTPNTYSITLNNETPTTEVTTSVSVTYDSNSQLSITLPTKDGYTLDGWYTSETDGNGSGTKVIDVNGNLQANVTNYTGANGIWKKAANTTLYAKWILNSDKTITLNNQGATTAGTESMTVRFKTNNYSTGSTSISVPAKDYYHFAGYYSASSGGVQVIDAVGNVVADVEGYTDSDKKWINGEDETMLYAHWTGISYSVRFNANTGSGSMSNQDFVYGTPQNLTLNAFEKTCTVTYDANGGSCGIASSETDYPFSGWATSAAGDVVYEDEAEVGDLTTTEDAIVDLYAKWSASPSTVELPTPTKENGVFTGWYNADEVLVGTAGDFYTPSGNETLKAHWKPGASSENNNDDVSDGKIVINGPHATFTIAGPTDIYYYTEGSCGDDGYFLASIDKEQSKTYTLSWSCDPSCTIEVTKISFWAKAYNWAAGRASKAKVIFNEKTTSVGTAALTCNSADYAKLKESGSFSSPMTIECQNTFDAPMYDAIPPYDFDFYLKNIVFEYTITPNAPTPHNIDLDATLNLEDKQTVDVRVGSGSLFTMTDPADDFTYSYRLKEDYANAYLEDGNFWATAGGDYEVQACVASGDDHEASVWSTATIHVTRTCVFHNTTGDKEWETTGNWAHSATPTAGDAVRVQGNLIVDEQIEMLSLSIEGAAVVEIAPTGGLTVGAGGISGATSDNLILKAGTSGATKGQTGYLRISPEYTGAMPVATVELYSIGYYNKAERETQKAAWQFVGAPIADEGVAAKSVYTKSWIYNWDESTNNWVNNRATLTFSPFVGYETTQYKDASGLKLVYSGTLVSGVDIYTLDLTYSSDGYNALANSFAAPIDISQFTASDFINAEPTISVLNTGTQEQSDNPGEDVNAPGKFLSIPVATATDLASSFGYPLVIPSMQGFFVQANSAGAKIKLDYNRLVWTADYSGLRENKPLRAPANTKDGQEELGSLKVTITANGWTDHTYLLESEKYADWYERGYDARKIMSEDMDIYTISGDEKLSVNATNSIIGTRLGVRTGGETAYTLVFTNLRTEDELALYDKETDEAIDINNYTEYTFFAEPETEINDRFYIIARGDAPAIATDIDHVSDATKAHKFIKDNQLLILKNGVLYNATGEIVR